jgi:hypothetical protein
MDTKTLLMNIGGQAAIARECEISESAVSQWATDDALPNARRQYLRLAHPGDHWNLYDAYLANKAKASADSAQPATETVASEG